MLTLSGGRTIILDSAQTGMLSRQGNADVHKIAAGQLLYVPAGSSNASSPSSTPVPVVYNTITTPRGGQYKVVLPDGSKVWLNAASSLHFPTTFAGRERRVTVTGEACFEVARDVRRPFFIDVDSSMVVQVLGTTFNIMAYSDESAIKTTLIRGAVKVIRGTAAALLHPGEQAQVLQIGNGPISLIQNADTAEAIAWTTGFFQFQEMDIRTIMRQIARWYNVDIIYDVPDSRLTGRRFGGRISRTLNLSDVLQILEANKIHFKLEGTKIHVLP